MTDTKDRIRQIMEDQHMTQHVFADFLQQSPATLSSIFNGRTRPTLNIVDAIKSKIPTINIEWLLYGKGDMYLSPTQEQPVASGGTQPGYEPMLNFELATSEQPQSSVATVVMPTAQQPAKKTVQEAEYEAMKKFDKEPRKVTEIRVYYDDQTYETFVPAKK